METIIDRLESLINEHGITKRALATKLNIAESTMFSWFSAKGKEKNLKDSNIKMFADYFGVSYDWLKTGTGERLYDPKSFESIPVLESNDLEEIAVPNRFFYNLKISWTECRFLKFKGLSCEPYICNGDKLLIHYQDAVLIESQAVYVIKAIDNSYTCIRLEKDIFSNTITLKALNGELIKKLSFVEYQNCVKGTYKVLALIRSFN